MLRAIAISALLAALVPGVARGASWRWPVRGRVVGSFSLSPDDPYAAGQRRGIAIRAAPGSPVSSTCAGRVRFAGAVGRAGPTLSVTCGALRATYQGLASIAVRTGDVVLPEQHIALLGAEGILRLGARVERRAGGMTRYVDPARLLGAGPRRLPPLGRAPRPGRPERRGPPVPPARPFPPIPAPRPVPVELRPAQDAEPARAPALVWIGLAICAVATPLGALVRRRQRRRHGRPRQARANLALRWARRP